MKLSHTESSFDPPKAIKSIFNTFYKEADTLIRAGLDAEPILNVVKKTGRVTELSMKEYGRNHRTHLSKTILISPQVLFTMFVTEAWAAEPSEEEAERDRIVRPSKREDRTEVIIFLMDGFRGSELLGLAPIVRDEEPHHLGHLIYHTPESAGNT